MIDFDASYAVAGAVTGFVVGVTGVGGGALMTPILLLMFGVAPATAIATDLWFASITKLVGARIHSQGGHVDWEVVKRLWTGSLPMAALVVLLVSLGMHVGKISWLSQAVGVVVIMTACGILLSPRLTHISRSRRLTEPAKFKRFQPALTVASGAALGLAVALTSVGAGALGSVILLYLYPLRMTPHRLVATDLVHAIPLALVAGLGYLLAGLVDWSMLASLLCGSVPAIVVGSMAVRRLQGKWVRMSLAGVLLLAGAKTLA